MPRLRARASALALLLSAAARAQAPPEHAAPRVEVASCPEDLRGSLPSLVKLEIDVLLRERGPTHESPERIAIRCEGAGAHLEVTLGALHRESNLELGALAGEHRARAIALATAELVDSMETRVPEASQPYRAEAATPAPAPRREVAPARPPAWRRQSLAIGGLAEWMGRPATVLFGARLVFHGPGLAFLVPVLSVDGAAGGFHARSAQISVTTLSGGAHLCFSAATGGVRWDVGPGARFGWSRLAGEPDAGANLVGHRLTAAWGGPEARARVAYGALPGQSPLLALELGAGVVALPVRGLADGTAPIYALEGPWFSVSAEVGLGM